MKKWRAWFIWNKKIIITTFLTLLSLLLVIGSWRFIWIKYFPTDYVLDLSVSISDIIQICVVAVALIGPLFVDYVKRRIQRPIISVKFFDDHRNIFTIEHPYIKNGVRYKGGVTYARHYCLTIKNIGKSKLKDCEAVLKKVINVTGDEPAKELFIPQINLKWLDNNQLKEIDINPGKELVLPVLFFNPNSIAESSEKLFFKINDTNENQNGFGTLTIGSYYFLIDFYSSNADVVHTKVHFTFSEGKKLSDYQWLPEGTMDFWKITNLSPFKKQ